MELSNVEKLAVCQAFQKVVGEHTKTGRSDNLRGMVDAEMRERYEADPMAGRSYDVKVQGCKVGTYSLTVSKPKPSRTEKSLEVLDDAEFLGWALREGYMMVDMDAVVEHFNSSGEVPAGCGVVETVIPGEIGGEVTRTTLKVEPFAVEAALGGMVGEVARGLLEDGGYDGF